MAKEDCIEMQGTILETLMFASSNQQKHRIFSGVFVF